MSSFRLFFIVSMAILLMLSCLTNTANAESFSNRRRRSREVEEKLGKLDDATKQRIHAMKASGMPNEAIAEKIAYVAGGKGTAKRIVEAINHEPPKRPQSQPKTQTKTQPKPQTKAPPVKPKPQPKTSAAAKNAASQPTSVKRK